MSTNSPAVSKRPSMSRRLRPLSITWVRPLLRGLGSRSGTPSQWLEAGIELLQLLLRGGLDVVVERVAVGVDPDRERAEVLHPEFPEALGHELLPGDLLDLLDDHVGQALVAGLGLALGDAEPVVRGGHRAPPASFARRSGRRGRASCRGRRSRP